jgi:hypothetical protein
MRSTTGATLLFTLICAGVAFAMFQLAGIPVGMPHLLVLLWHASSTLALLHWQEGSMHGDPNGFVRRFMAGLVAKMFLSLMLLVAFLLVVDRQQAMPLALLFVALYLAFLGFSTGRLGRLLRKAGGR